MYCFTGSASICRNNESQTVQGLSSLPNRSAPFRPVINYDHFVGSLITPFLNSFTLNGLVSLALFGATLLPSLHL